MFGGTIQLYSLRKWNTPCRGLFAILCAGLLLIAGCSVGPKYVKPTTEIPPTYKELGTWKPAQPSDEAHKGNWWEIFQDPQLNGLEDKLSVSNQTLRAAQDRFVEARAALRISRSAQFPMVTVGSTITRQRQSLDRALASKTAPASYSDFLVSGGDASYEADVWGRVRHAVESSREQAQASAADLETVRLTLHAELALDYFTLRGLDEQKKLFDSNVDAFQKAVDLTQNRFQGGLASREDVELATTQLEQTRAQDIDITSARDQFEHAIAVLTGQPASTFEITAAPMAAVPPVPPGLPSELLERRPDIAGAERRVASANAQIGVARAAYFPLITLGLEGGFESGSFTNWLSGPSAIWSVGGSALQTVFDAGRRRAISDQAKAAYDETVADYQQTVLTSFQEVEDSLADLRVLEEEAKTQYAAVAAANRSLEQSNNRYRGGLDTYLTVITAQSAVLTNERTAVGLLTRRMTSTVLLVKALGGGWNVSQLPAVD